MHQALYRKWRSRTFDDLVGQDAVSRTLRHQVAGGTLSHAYLFCGTRGTGKTSSARILAKAVNCLDPRDGNPCCACEICKGIEEETLLDVTEIDAASNSGVDNIRELREEAHFTPAAAKYRVYIIDETHMLSTGAFNALLKILEEPPEHVIFILATTEIHKVPATILSRCQRFDFHRLDSELIAKHLLYIAEEEGIDLREDAALLLAKLADGGMRDAISLLDLVMAQGGELTAETVTERAGLVGREHLFALGEAIASKDTGAVLGTLQKLWEKSIDYQRLCEQLIGFYRDLMVAKAVAEPDELIACLPEELGQYRTLAKGQNIHTIIANLGILQETLSRMSRSSQRRTELEMGLLRMTDPAMLDGTSELSSRIDALEKGLREGISVKVAEVSGPIAEVSSERRMEATAKTKQPEASGEKIPMEPFPDWDKVLAQLEKKNKALHATLLESTAYEGGDLLLVDTEEGSMFIQMMRGDTYAKDSLRAAVEAVTGKKYRLGPYNPERYEVKKADPLLAMLKKASELGVDVEVKD